jgi:hypothetical protein
LRSCVKRYQQDDGIEYRRSDFSAEIQHVRPYRYWTEAETHAAERHGCDILTGEPGRYAPLGDDPPIIILG